MTTTIKINVNGRYRTTVKQTSQDGSTTETVIEGNYEGSPNPGGTHFFYLGHPANASFEISEEYLGDPVPAQAGDTATSSGD